MTVRRRPRWDRGFARLEAVVAGVLLTLLAACGSPREAWPSPASVSTGSPPVAATPSAMVSPSSVPASPGPTTASLGDWTAQELYLVAGIPDDIRATCAPTRPAEVTNAAAEVTCHPDEPLVDSIGYYLFTEDGAARQVYTDRLAEYDVHVEDRASGESCESGTPGERPQSPAADDVSAPRLGCFVNEFRVANLRALTPPFVYVGVLGTGGEIAPLDDWARGGDETLGAIPRVAVLWWPPEPTS